MMNGVINPLADVKKKDIGKIESGKFRLITKKDNKIVMIKNSLLKCSKVTEEVQRVKYNYRDLFNEKK